MARENKTYYYRPVTGSRELVTGTLDGDEVLSELEREAGEGLAPLRSYHGEWLGGARLGDGVSVPPEVFDELALDQSPLEQTVFLHLFRLSYGKAGNFCRVGKKELRNRSGVSDRRLNVALDGLVRKGHIKPMHRNTAGTLYRVYLPSEIKNRELTEKVEWGEKIEGSAPETEAKEEKTKKEQAPESETPPAEKKKPEKPRTRPLESPLNEERFADFKSRKQKGPSLAEMADWFFDTKGMDRQNPQRQTALTALTSLLEDGYAREEIMQALQWFAKNVPDETDLMKLPYFINRALEEGPAE
ncbi:MAG: hypothetical protein R6V10_15330 [bacterium]